MVELVVVNGVLCQQYFEKVVLMECLVLLLDVLLVGVILIGYDNVVVQSNLVVEVILVCFLQGVVWFVCECECLVVMDVFGEFCVCNWQVVMIVIVFDLLGVCIVLLYDVSEIYVFKQQVECSQCLVVMGEMVVQLVYQLCMLLVVVLLYIGNFELLMIVDVVCILIVGKVVGCFKYLEWLIQDMLLFVCGEVLGCELFFV